MEEASWPYAAHIPWQESVGCNNGCLYPSVPSHKPLLGPAAQQRPGLVLGSASLQLQEHEASDKHSSRAGYAEEALPGKKESCRGPSASPFQQEHKYNALFTLSVPVPRSPPHT